MNMYVFIRKIRMYMYVCIRKIRLPLCIGTHVLVEGVYDDVTYAYAYDDVTYV